MKDSLCVSLYKHINLSKLSIYLHIYIVYICGFMLIMFMYLNLGKLQIHMRYHNCL